MEFRSCRGNHFPLSIGFESDFPQAKPPLPPTITFARRTSSGRYANYSRDDLDNEISRCEFSNYTVHIPPTPDNQPMEVPVDPSISAKVEEQYVSNSPFTGGFNSATRVPLMDKVIKLEINHPQMAGAKGSSCEIRGCDSKLMSDERGEVILPCECGFKICQDCYLDDVKAGEGICPGCKEPYKAMDLDELAADAGQPLSLLDPNGMSKMERRQSMMKSTKSVLMRSQTSDWDQNRWLFETKGTYGYGNAILPKEGDFGKGKDDGNGEGPKELVSKPWRPLTRKLKIPTTILSPYRKLRNASSLWQLLELIPKTIDNDIVVGPPLAVSALAAEVDLSSRAIIYTCDGFCYYTLQSWTPAARRSQCIFNL